MVLENVQQGQNLDERSQEEEEDFEAAIQHNKQKIRHNMQKERSHPPKSYNRQPQPPSIKPSRSLTRHELQEKRFKEASLDNRLVQKKKEIVALKN